MASWGGTVIADYIEVRFAFAGKVAAVNKKSGDRVQQWDWIAVLDKKLLQIELDRQLSDYEKIRADFEIFRIQHPDDTDDIVKFTRVQKQSALNAAVKEVEAGKYRMDQCTLISPVNGVISSMDGLIPGIHVTPAGVPVTVIDDASKRFVFDIPQSELVRFESPHDVKLSFPGAKKEYEGHTSVPISGKNDKFAVTVCMTDTVGLLPGMAGTVHMGI